MTWFSYGVVLHDITKLTGLITDQSLSVDKAQLIFLSSGLAAQPESIKFGGALAQVSFKTTQLSIRQ